MKTDGEATMEGVRERRKSGQAERANGSETLRFQAVEVGQYYPHHYPHRGDFEELTGDDPLGEPMSISKTARLLGCSIWNVRHRYLPLGLPYFRIGRTGKLMFYRKQIVQWILEKQKAERR